MPGTVVWEFTGRSCGGFIPVAAPFQGLRLLPDSRHDPFDFLAAVTAHIPDQGEHLVRYYGWYSSVRRGCRRRLSQEEPSPRSPPPQAA